MTFVATLQRDARGAERHAVELDGTLRGADRRPVDVGITDLSRTGFCATGFDGLTPGTGVSIGLPGLGVRQARVTRVDGAQCGCQFHDDLTLAELSDAMAAVLTAPIPFPSSAREGLILQTSLPKIERYSARLRVTLLAAATALAWMPIVGARLLLR